MDDMLVRSVLARLGRVPLGPAEEQLLFAALEDTETIEESIGRQRPPHGPGRDAG